MRGISVNIFRSDLGDCTNGGVTNPANKGKIFVVFDESISDGNWELAECEANPERFVCLKVVRRWEGTPREYIHIEPMEHPSNRIGPMAGGNYVHSSDDRFRALSQYPLPVHDRFETPSQYDSNWP